MKNPLPLTDADGEVRELTAEDFKHFRPAAEVLPELFGELLAAKMLRTVTPKPQALAQPSQNHPAG